MHLKMVPIMTLLVAVSAAPGAVASKPSLQHVAKVEDGLFSVAVADKIRRECAEISGRLIKAHFMLLDLFNSAKSEGYTDAEIESYVSSETQKSRMREKRDAYLATQGVVASDPASYCAAGYAEIEKSSQIGELLRAR